MSADQQPPAETVHDDELPYGQRVPTSYDAEAVAALLDAHASHYRESGRRLLADDVIAMLIDVVRAFAKQFRGVGQEEDE